MKVPPALPWMFALAAAAGGFWLGRQTAPAVRTGSGSTARSEALRVRSAFGLPEPKPSPGVSGGSSTRQGSASPAAETALSQEEAVEQIHAALAEPNRTARTQRLSQMLSGMSRENWEKTIEAFIVQTTHEGRKHDEEWHAALARVGEVDGERALQRFFHQEKSGAWSAEAATVLSGWASKEPQAARAWLEQLPDGGSKMQMAQALVAGMAPENPQEAAAFVLSLAPDLQPNFAGNLVEGALQNGGFAAADGILRRARGEKGSADPLVQAVFKGVADRVFFSNWVGKTPERACSWVLEHVGQPYVTPDILHHAAGDYAIKDPLAAIEWVGAQSGRFGPDGTAAAVQGVVHRWTGSGYEGITRWLSVNTNHPLYDLTTASFVHRAAATDPAAASEWSATIVDPVRRDEAEGIIKQRQQELQTRAVTLPR